MTPEERKLVPDWLPERFYNTTVDPAMKDKDSMTLEWVITKVSMIATLNWIRVNKKLKCEWIEKGKDNFIIKISKPSPTPPHS